MTLYEFLEKSNPEAIVHIGDSGGTAFYLIGKVSYIRHLLDEMPEGFRRAHEEEINVFRKEHDELVSKKLVRCNHEPSYKFEKRKKTRENQIAAIDKKINAEQNRAKSIDEAIDAIKRKEVACRYRRLNPEDGWNVLLNGSKCGMYWDLEEWNKDHGDGVNMTILYHRTVDTLRRGGIRKGETWANLGRTTYKRQLNTAESTPTETKGRDGGKGYSRRIR